MNSSLILMKSITEAHKARKQLSKYRMKSVIEKIHTRRRGGCQYGIRVYDDPQKICRLLSIVGIDCDDAIDN